MGEVGFEVADFFSDGGLELDVLLDLLEEQRGDWLVLGDLGGGLAPLAGQVGDALGEGVVEGGNVLAEKADLGGLSVGVEVGLFAGEFGADFTGFGLLVLSLLEEPGAVSAGHGRCGL